MFEKLKIIWLWVLITNYQIITCLFVLVTFYPKKEKKKRQGLDLLIQRPKFGG